MSGPLSSQYHLSTAFHSTVSIPHSSVPSQYHLSTASLSSTGHPTVPSAWGKGAAPYQTRREIRLLCQYRASHSARVGR
eukprot:3938223-Rhodomonas_salina.3